MHTKSKDGATISFGSLISEVLKLNLGFQESAEELVGALPRTSSYTVFNQAHLLCEVHAQVRRALLFCCTHM